MEVQSWAYQFDTLLVRAPNRERVDGQRWQMAGDGERVFHWPAS